METARQKREEIKSLLNVIEEKTVQMGKGESTAQETLRTIIFLQGKIQEHLDWLHAHHYADHLFNGMLHEGETCQGECIARDFKRHLSAIPLGAIIVYLETPFTISIGRVAGDVRYYSLEEALRGGISAEFDLLEVDQIQEATRYFFEAYSSLNVGIPHSGIYLWPEAAMPLTFTKAGSWKHIQVPCKVGPYFVHELRSQSS